jgi:hypothetical protein
MASAMMLPMDSSELAEMVPTWAMALLSVQGLESALSSIDRGVHRLVDAALEVHRVHAGGDGLQALADHGLGQHGGGGGAVTGDVGGVGGDLLDHLRAHVLELVLELDLLGHGDAVLGHGRGAEGLLQHHVAALGAEGHLHRVGEDVDALHHADTGVVSETNVFCTHWIFLEYLNRESGMARGWVDGGCSALDDAHDVVLAHHQELLAVELDLGARVLAEEHRSPTLTSRGRVLAVVEDLAVADGDDLALDRLLGGGIGDDDATGGGALLLHAADHDAVVQGTDVHLVSPRSFNEGKECPGGGAAARLLALTGSECQ